MRIPSNSRSKKDNGWMSGWVSLVIIVVLGMVALALLTSGSRVWATEGQSRLYQTVPTATFTPAPPADTATPTKKPAGPTKAPTHTPRPEDPTTTPTALPVEPTLTPTPSMTPTTAAPLLVLAQTSSSTTVLPGADLTFTLQLSNPGPEELRDLLIEDVLPDSLLLQDVAVYGGEPEITGNRFTLALDRLAPGLPLIITVRTQVAPDASPGTVIDHQPTVTAAGVEQRWPLLSVVLPPAALPATGDTCLGL